jgi:Raf kinase inhibitor-like YbhB/YbcL family protein
MNPREADSKTKTSPPHFKVGARGLALWTDALNDEHRFDHRYTCDIDNSSPELRWKGAPSGTRSFVLLLEDLSTSEPFTHWLVYSIPPEVDHLPAGIPPQDKLANGIRQGLNSSKKLGYMGPCPPIGHPEHRYRFALYALNSDLHIPPRATREQVLDLIQPHILDQAEIIGLHQRSREYQAAG